MIFVDQLKNMKIYRRPMFLPTLENDKKKKSAIMLLTPNYLSSERLMNHPLLINKLRFQSYYLQPDVSYYINGKSTNSVLKEEYVYEATQLDFYQNLYEMSASERNKIKDFGLPQQKKYPLHDEKHVRSAIRFFNYCSKSEEEELANNIIKAIKKYNMNVNIGDNNRLKKYYTEAYKEEGLEFFDEGVVYSNTPQNPLLSVSAIITNEEGKILVLDHVKCAAYTIPGGKVDETDTTLGEAIKREVREELGIEVKSMAKFCVNNFCCNYPTGSDQYIYVADHTFIIHTYDGEITNTEPEKHKAIEWMDRDDLCNSTSIPMSRLLQCYLSNWRKSVNDISHTLTDFLNSFIYFSGFSKDIDVIRRIITPAAYYEILAKRLDLPMLNIKDIPILKITVTEPDHASSTFTTSTDNGHLCVNVNVPRYELGALDTYILDIYSILYKAILEAKYPILRNTRFPQIISDYLTDNDTKYKQIAYTIFTGLGLNIKDIIIATSRGDYDCIIPKCLEINKDLRRTDFFKEEYTPDNTVSNYNTEVKYKGVETIQKESVEVMNSNIFDELEMCYEETDYLRMGDIITFFTEAGKYDSELRHILYAERIKQRGELLLLLKDVKERNAWIKFAFPDLDRYQGRNVFVDLYFYNEVYFKNSTWKMQKGYNLYLELLQRLINDPRITKAGYEKKTIFIPVLDWANNPSSKMWLYREDINPISILFELMKNNSPLIKKTFKDTDIIFFDKDKYFKLNFSQVEDIPKTAQVLKRFITIITSKAEFSAEDIDTTLDSKESSKTIKANLIDQIELSTGVDITGKELSIKKSNDAINASKPGSGKKATPYDPVSSMYRNTTDAKSPATIEAEEKAKEKNLTKTSNPEKEKEKEAKMIKLASIIDDVSANATDTDDAFDRLDNFDDMRDLIIDINSMRDDEVKIDDARSARMSDLDKQFLAAQVKGKSVKELLDTTKTNTPLSSTSLKIDSPNEEWKDMKFMNFDKDYDLDKDIVACFYHFTKTSKPISIRNINVTDNSTSEDRLDLYTVEMEDFKGTRFTVKLDIPRMVDNRLLLRGNAKAIQTQLFNMPILKTEPGVAQVVTNYQKIFVRRKNTSSGRSNAKASVFIKAIEKYTGKDIKITSGDNTRIADKYELPIDYIDISGVISKFETEEAVFYFNQSEMRELYPTIDDNYGVPIGVIKKTKEIIYYKMTEWSSSVVDTILQYTSSKDFYDLVVSLKPSTSSTYSECSILNTKIPLVIVVAYTEGLTKVLQKAGVQFRLTEKITSEERRDLSLSYIKFEDGYLIYNNTYTASMLLSGLKICPTDIFSMTDIDNKNMYIEFLDNFGGRVKADGLDNFYDCLIDPMTLECLQYYKLPTDFVSVLLYANMLLCDNKYIAHTDMSSRRIRRTEMIAAYTYEVLSLGYAEYANMIKHSRGGATIAVKQSSVIDKILTSPISSDDSIINALYAIETTNSITYKGKAGLNDDRSYSLDKRTYDNSMLNTLGMSTGFSANVGVTRQATMDMNVDSSRGYVKSIDGDTSKMNAAKSLCATEGMTPFGTTRDDTPRTYMTFVQTAKHMVRTIESDPLLVTNGTDQAIPYLTIDKFAFKAKDEGKIKEIKNDQYIIVEYKNGKKDYINLKETVEKNSDGGFFVPLKLSKMEGLKVGDKVVPGQILAYDKTSFSNSVGESDNISYNIGKLVKVAIINTDEGFEDSGVCSERLSKKLSSRIIKKVDKVIDKDANIFKMARIGDLVEVEDPLLIWQDPHDDEEVDSLLRIMGTNATKDEVHELGRKTLRSIMSGKVADIKIYRTVELDELSPSLKKIVQEYEAPIIELKKKLDSEGLSSTDLPATYKLAPEGKLKKAQEAILIEYYLEYSDTVAIGDKITYFSANKAIIKNILPDDKAPYTDFRPNEPLDAFLSQTSVDKRMVSSLIIQGSINKLLIELDRSCKDILGIKYDDTQV